MKMWLFFFHDSEHRKLSTSLERLKEYVRKTYDYAQWEFNAIDKETYQVIEVSGNRKSEQGFILTVEII